jgi:hypothetical protein
MVKRFMSSCEAKSRSSIPSPSSSASSSSSAAAAAAALSSPLESSFDNLDILFCTAAEDQVDINQEQEGMAVKESGLEFQDIDEANIDSRKVYFPEISLSDALEVTCGLLCGQLHVIGHNERRHLKLICLRGDVSR